MTSSDSQEIKTELREFRKFSEYRLGEIDRRLEQLVAAAEMRQGRLERVERVVWALTVLASVVGVPAVGWIVVQVLTVLWR